MRQIVYGLIIMTALLFNTGCAALQLDLRHSDSQ